MGLPGRGGGAGAVSASISLVAEGLDEAFGCAGVTNWSEVAGIAMVAGNFCEASSDEDSNLPGTFLVFLLPKQCAQIYIENIDHNMPSITPFSTLPASKSPLPSNSSLSTVLTVTLPLNMVQLFKKGLILKFGCTCL